jgi:hypothetical protein
MMNLHTDETLTPFVLTSLVLELESDNMFQAVDAAKTAKMLDAWRGGFHGIPSILD